MSEKSDRLILIKQLLELDYTIISFHKRNKSDIELVLREGKS